MGTIQDSKTSLGNLREGILTLRDGFVIIDEREKNQRFVEFKISFLRLILAVKKAQENGLWRKTYFNLFETLGYPRLESLHSYVLAWLLNPEEAHGLGDEFLRAFIYKVFNKKDLPPFSNVKVVLEGQESGNRPDIVVEGNNWWLVIENKIDSSEQEGQTKRYADLWKRRGKLNENVLLAFISPSGWQPESPDFKPVSYRTIRELLERMHFQGDSNLLIRHFTEHILFDLEE